MLKRKSQWALSLLLFVGAERPAAEMSGLSMGGPKLPERVKKRLDRVPAEGALDTSALLKRASLLAGSPGLQQLLNNPDLLNLPQLQPILSLNPSLASMLQPDKLREVLQLCQQPEKLLSGEAASELFAGDLVDNRKVSTCGGQAWGDDVVEALATI